MDDPTATTRNVSKQEIVAMATSIAEITRRVNNFETILTQIQEAMIRVDTGSVKPTKPLLNIAELELNPRVRDILTSHGFFQDLFVPDDANPKLYHLVPANIDRKNENGAWRGQTTRLYLGGTHRNNKAPILWRQNIMPKLIQSNISFVYPAENPTERYPIDTQMAAVLVALQPDIYDISALAEIVRAMGLGLQNVFVVCEKLDALFLENKDTVYSCFRGFVPPWTQRQEAQEVYDIITYILKRQTTNNHVFETIEDCVSSLVYSKKDMIFGPRESIKVDPAIQLDIVAHLLEKMAPKSDLAWIFVYAYAKYVFDNAQQLPLFQDMCRSKNLDMEAISICINLCESIKDKDRVDDALAILFPKKTTLPGEEES